MKYSIQPKTIAPSAKNIYVIQRTKPIKRAVLFPNEYKDTMASARIAKWVAEQLDVELWDAPHKIKYEEIDELYFIYGMVAFSQFREEMGALNPYVKKYIYIENDYLGSHLTQLRKPMRDQRGIQAIMITTCPHRLQRARGWYCDFNRLTWDPVPRENISPQEEREQALSYYGFYRKDRIQYFETYFKAANFPIHIFCGKGGQSKYRALNPNLILHDQAPDLNVMLNQYACTLYLEDKFSHTHFTSIGNRFYECLAAGVPMLFDENAAGTLKKGGFDVSPYTVRNPEDIEERWPQLSDIQAEQFLWRRDFKEELRQQFHSFLPKIAACDPKGFTVVP